MSLANTSQLLIKNISLLEAKQPLFINLPADAFINEYQSSYPNAEMSFFNYHYGEYLAHQKKGANCQFSHVYQAKVLHDLVVISFPKSKPELAYTLAMINDVVSDDAIIYCVGDKNSGVKSVEKLAQGFLAHCQKDDAARHCMLYSGGYLKKEAIFNLDEWFHQYDVPTASSHIKICALPGVFSQAKLDIGTKLLLENVPEYNNKSVLDFGCGAGVIAAYIAKHSANSNLTLADVNALAIASAKQTFSTNNLTANFISTDSMSNIKESYDDVISNPPFHQGLKTNYQATESFLDNINKHIKKGGTLTIVANSFLKYQPIMEKHFSQVQQIMKANGFTIFRAKK